MPADFVALARAARELPGLDTHDRLWMAWFAEPAWHFIKAPSPAGWLPHAQAVNGERCVLAFTDAARADGYSRFARLPIDPRVQSPVMTLPPDAAMRVLPQLGGWGVTGMVVDLGPDQFYAPFHALFGMYHRYRAPAPAGPHMPPPAPRPPPPPPPRVSPPRSTRPETVDDFLALPVWHVATTKEDRTFPDFAFRGSELVAQVYSTPRPPPCAAMAPRDAIALLSDIELVGFVRFDDMLEVQLVDLALHAHTR